jgi:hypothetical protein
VCAIKLANPLGLCKKEGISDESDSGMIGMCCKEKSELMLKGDEGEGGKTI